MYSPDSLLDIHRRTHRSLVDLFDHLSNIDPPEINRELEGFGYPTLRLQCHHMVGAEHYWMAVLQGRIEVTDERDYPDLASLGAYRTVVFEATEAYLESAATQDINTARPLMTWGDKEKILVPATVFMRTQTHHFTHLGQILAMLRQLGHPARGLDFPLD